MKLLLFSHRSDVDGITPVILSKIAFEEVDFILEEPSTINETFKSTYGSNTFDNYDIIYVTDLCINHELARKLMQDEKNKNKVRVFDHHHTNEDMNIYPFITVKDSENGKKECGSSLFFKHLLETYPNDILKKSIVSEMVELVRLIDTWEWKKENVVEATWISNILGIYGTNYYIDYYYQLCLEKEHFEFSENQKYLFEAEEIRIKNYVEKKEKEIIPVALKNYHVGVVFAELYRSSVGNILAEKYQEIYDFIIVINISRSVSYRGVKEEIDLGQFAQYYGGAGHRKAAGSSLPEHLLEDIVKMIFQDAEMKKGN